ncbi:MAG: SIS domain-containing protein [Rhizomicrobium sp.]
MSLFPEKSYSDIGAYIGAYSRAVGAAFASIDLDQMRKAASALEDAVLRKATIFVCGNGGSASISNHFVCDHVKGARNGTDFHPKVASLSTNIEILTAIANDIGYENVFDFQLASLAAEGDVLVAISSSGGSPNIVNALRWARAHHVVSIVMCGFDGGEGRKLADIPLHVDAYNYGVVEDVHQSMMHILAQFARQKRLLDPTQLGRVKF